MQARPIMTGLLGAGLAVSAVVGAVRVFMSQPRQDLLAPREQIEIRALRAPLPQPSFLACPSGYCAVHPQMTTPVFLVPWQRLRDDWTKAIAAEPRVVSIGSGSDEHRLVYIQHSLIFRFPDIVTVEFVPLSADRSSIAVFSQSRYGRGDFGVNQKRVERLLPRLETIVQPARKDLTRQYHEPL